MASRASLVYIIQSVSTYSGQKNVKNTKKLEKARMRGGAGGSRGSRGVWGGSRVPGRVRGFGRKNAKKTEKRSGTVWLRSNIQDFVQEVPVGQMAQGTPFRCLPANTICLYVEVCTPICTSTHV